MLIYPDNVSALPKNPKFICLEGLNGAGKSTLQGYICGYLSRNNIDNIATREPGPNTWLGSHIREILLNHPDDKLCAISEMLLFAADRAQHVREIIKPALPEKVVVCDRYFYSSIAFQGYGRKIDIKTVTSVNEFAIDGCLPEIIFLLDLDPRIGLKRKGEERRDSFEREMLDFHKRVREGFLEIARTRKEPFVIINTERSQDEVLEELLWCLRSMYERH